MSESSADSSAKNPDLEKGVEKESLVIVISRSLCALAFTAAGLNHFFNPSMYCKIMPAYLPFPLELVYLSGVFEVLGGIGLFIPAVRSAAVWGLILLLAAVFPANINMALHPELTPKIPAYVLYLRLPLQFLLIWWVWCCKTKMRTS